MFELAHDFGQVHVLLVEQFEAFLVLEVDDLVFSLQVFDRVNQVLLLVLVLDEVRDLHFQVLVVFHLRFLQGQLVIHLSDLRYRVLYVLVLLIHVHYLLLLLLDVLDQLLLQKLLSVQGLLFLVQLLRYARRD